MFLLLMVSHPPKEGVQSARIVFLFLIQWGQDQILKHGDQLLADYNKAVRVTVENESVAANAKKVDQLSTAGGTGKHTLSERSLQQEQIGKANQ